MNSMPENLSTFVWVVSNIGLPLSLGLVVGISVRPIIRCLTTFCIMALVLICILSLTGVGSFEVTGFSGLNDGISSVIGHVVVAVREVTLRFPAGAMGLMLGIVLREFWTSRLKVLHK